MIHDPQADTKSYCCDRCGCALYNGYPFTVCDDCWPHRSENTRTRKEPAWWINQQPYPDPRRGSEEVQ